MELKKLSDARRYVLCGLKRSTLMETFLSYLASFGLLFHLFNLIFFLV